MHQMSKVIGYGATSYTYKDGKGGTLNNCAQIMSFIEDFRSLELCFRRQDNAELLSSTALELGIADLRCKTQFNVTHCAGEMHQYLSHPVQPRIQYLSHCNDGRPATIRGAEEPTPCALPSADPYSLTATSDPLSNQAAHQTLPSRIIPGTPDPESPSTTPPRHPTYAAVVRRQ